LLLAGLSGRPRAASRLELEVAGVKLLLSGVDVSLVDDERLGTDDLPSPSPSRTRASTAFSRFPPTPFKTIAFLWPSLKPISRSLASFLSVSSPSFESP